MSDKKNNQGGKAKDSNTLAEERNDALAQDSGVKRFMPAIILAGVGVVVAIAAVLLQHLGNPGNMGFCVACFLRDTAGAVGLHSAALVQYVRPEVVGIVLGAFALALIRREFTAKAGSAPMTRFVLGFGMMMGALIFLGCPLRMILRLAGGDLNAIVGLGGIIFGIFVGTLFLRRGFSLQRGHEQGKMEGAQLPIIALVLLGIVLAAPAILLVSVEGPGSMHAPMWIALLAGLGIGALGLFSRLCFTGGIRDLFLMKKFPPMLFAIVALLIVATVGNLLLGNFNLSWVDQPVAHNDGVWNFLGMALVGLCATLLAGCPFRQMVLAGSGNADSAFAVLGMAVGAAFMHNFSMAASPAGISENTIPGFIVVTAVVLGIAVFFTFFRKKDTPAETCAKLPSK